MQKSGATLVSQILTDLKKMEMVNLQLNGY